MELIFPNVQNKNLSKLSERRIAHVLGKMATIQFVQFIGKLLPESGEKENGTQGTKSKNNAEWGLALLQFFGAPGRN
jgi:hypothetical protein